MRPGGAPPQFHFLHHWRTAVRSGADHKPVAFPGYLFFDGQVRMPKLVTESPGRCLLAFADFSAVDHHVLVVRAAADSERAPKENLSKCIRASSCCCVQALFFEVMA